MMCAKRNIFDMTLTYSFLKSKNWVFDAKKFCEFLSLNRDLEFGLRKRKIRVTRLYIFFVNGITEPTEQMLLNNVTPLSKVFLYFTVSILILSLFIMTFANAYPLADDEWMALNSKLAKRNQNLIKNRISDAVELNEALIKHSKRDKVTEDIYDGLNSKTESTL